MYGGNVSQISQKNKNAEINPAVRIYTAHEETLQLDGAERFPAWKNLAERYPAEEPCIPEQFNQRMYR